MSRPLRCVLCGPLDARWDHERRSEGVHIITRRTEDGFTLGVRSSVDTFGVFWTAFLHRDSGLGFECSCGNGADPVSRGKNEMLSRLESWRARRRALPPVLEALRKLDATPLESARAIPPYEPPF